MTTGAESVRAFVAVELSEDVRQALAAVQRAVQRHVPSGVRWVAPESVHLTLKFLGDVPVARLGAVTEAMRLVAAGCASFDVTLNGVGAFPNGRSPMVVWVGLAGDTAALLKLAKALETALAALGFPPEGRPFSSHLTLGRARDRMTTEERQCLATLLAQPPQVAPAAMRVESISLMRSVLNPSGAQYTRLAEVGLGSSG